MTLARRSGIVALWLGLWLPLSSITSASAQQDFGEPPPNSYSSQSPPTILASGAGSNNCLMSYYTGWIFGPPMQTAPNQAPISTDIPTSGVACTVYTQIPGSKNGDSCGVYTERKKTMTAYECQGFCNAMQNFCPYGQVRQAEQSGPTFDFSNQSQCGRARRLAEYCLADLAAHSEKDKFKGDCTALTKRANDICTRTKALNPPPNPIADTKAAAVLDLPKPPTDAVPVNLNNSSPAEPPTPIIREKPPTKAALGPASPCGQVLRAQEVCRDTCGKVEKPEEQAICLKDCDSLKPDIEKLCSFGAKAKRKNAVAVVSPKAKSSKSNTAVCKTCSTARSTGVESDDTPRRIEGAATRSEGASRTRSFGTGATSGGGLATSQTRSISTSAQNPGSGSQTRTMSPSGVQNIGGASATSRDRPK